MSATFAAGSAAADEPRPVSPAAKPHLDRGLAHYSARDYVSAIAAFDIGYAIDPHPDFLYAKAQALRLGGDCRAAIPLYQRFLESSPPASEMELARGNIARCEKVLAATPPRAPDPPPPPNVVFVREPVAPAPPRWWRDPPGLTLAGGSALAFAVSAGFALHARGAADSLDDGGTLDDWLRDRDTWERDRVVAGVSLGLGVGLATTAAVRFWWVSRASRARTPLVPSVAPTDGGAVLILHGRSW